MAGIYGVFLKDKKVDKFYDLFNDPLLIKNELPTNEGVVGRSVLNKLNQDRFIEQRNDIILCFEGINLSDEINSIDNFFKQYLENGTTFLSKLKGTYSGFIYDKKKGKLFIFNDHLSTKNIFYYYNKSVGFVFSSELRSISKLFQKEKINYSIDRDAVYMMALYGFLLEDHTYIKEVKKLSYGSILTFDFIQYSICIENIRNYSKEKKSVSYTEAIDSINTLMEYSVYKNWSHDLKNGAHKHISLLSGGMDARTNVVIAKDLGFDNIKSITFGQSNSKDIKYARAIARGEKLNHFQRQLDNPLYLIDDIMENYIKPNDGLIMYHSSAHTSSTVKSFNLKNYSTMHTGQIGDVLFGSFARDNFNFHKNRGKIGYTGFISDDNLLDKIESLPEILKKYDTLGYELFSYEQRMINATIYGDRSLNDSIDNNSPFFNQELINFCISLPSSYKTNQMIYFDWLKKHHPRALDYSWDKIDMRPNSKFKIIYGKMFKKYINGGKKYFNLNYESMNPYGQWLKKFPVIIDTFDHIVSAENIPDYLDTELKEDLIKIYNNNIFEFRNKFAVVTAILAIKLHFEEN